MVKKYFYIILFFLSLSTTVAVAQDGKQSKVQDNTIEGLSFYPNPVSNGKIYITTRNNNDKEIIIFDVLGKKVLQTTISSGSKELNVSSLNSGVYIIQIKEDDSTATRKLIVN